MPSVQELYELWATESELVADLEPSLDPRGTDWLFDVFAGLGPQPGQLVLDAGARDARHAIRLVRDHGLRAVALDPLPLHVELARTAVAEAGLADEIEVVQGRIEELPLARLERAATAAGLRLVSSERLGGEWRERMIEDGDWDPSADLLRLSRLRRREAELGARHGAAAIEAFSGGRLWGIYQLLGKLCPAVYVWQRGG